MCTGRHRSQTKSSAHSRGGLGTGKWPPATSSLTATPTVTESSARTQSDPRELVPSLKVIPSPDTQLYRSLPPEKFPSTAPPLLLILWILSFALPYILSVNFRQACSIESNPSLHSSKTTVRNSEQHSTCLIYSILIGGFLWSMRTVPQEELVGLVR